MWIKYRHKYASHYGSWEYKDIPEGITDDSDIKERLDYYSLCESELYRGCDYEIIDVPPKEVLQLAVSKLATYIGNANRQLAEYNQLLTTFECGNHNE